MWNTFEYLHLRSDHELFFSTEQQQYYEGLSFQHVKLKKLDLQYYYFYNYSLWLLNWFNIK